MKKIMGAIWDLLNSTANQVVCSCISFFSNLVSLMCFGRCAIAIGGHCKYVKEHLRKNMQYSLLIYFLAQLWKYNGENLVNKNGDWIYLKNMWILPKPLPSDKEIGDKKSEGQDIRDSQGSVLKANFHERGMYTR